MFPDIDQSLIASRGDRNGSCTAFLMLNDALFAAKRSNEAKRGREALIEPLAVSRPPLSQLTLQPPHAPLQRL